MTILMLIFNQFIIKYIYTNLKAFFQNKILEVSKLYSFQLIIINSYTFQSERIHYTTKLFSMIGK